MEAFAPASVTVVFAPPDPGSEETRSRGASFALTDGVTVALDPADERRVTVDGEPSSFEPVERVLAALDVDARVDVRPDVPLGCGFGASGAATLATALAANERFGLDRSRDALVTAAHEAEVAAGTGLGDVYIQDRGGFLVGTDGGIVRAEPEASVAYESFGDIPTGDVLGDEATMARVHEHGTAALADLAPGDDFRAVFGRAWTFARETGLVTDRVARAVDRVADAGGAATMAMVGETVVAVDADGALSDEARVANAGARLL